jgi:hypothetical protein
MLKCTHFLRHLALAARVAEGADMVEELQAFTVPLPSLLSYNVGRDGDRLSLYERGRVTVARKEAERHVRARQRNLLFRARSAAVILH